VLDSLLQEINCIAMIPCLRSYDHHDLDFLLDHDDFVPQFNINSGRNIISSEFSTDSSCQNDISLMDIDLESELEKFLNEETEELPSITSNHLAAIDFELELNNNNEVPEPEDNVKVEIGSSESITKEEKSCVKVAQDHDYCIVDIVEPAVEYIGHLHLMPDITSPMSKRRILTQSNVEPRMKEKEVISRRKIIKLNQKTVHTQGGMKPQSQQFKGRVNGIKEIHPYPTHSSGFGDLTRLSQTAVLVKNPQAKQSKIRKGISILKGLPGGSLGLSGSTRINAAASKIMKRQLSAPATLQVKRRPQTTSGWVVKEDPVKEMKNEQERIRRSELAKYRENVKNMLPHIRELDKVATVDILEMAKVYCLQLQNWASETEWEWKLEYDWNNFLRTKLQNLIAEGERACLPGKITGSEEKIAIDKLFESYEVKKVCDFNYGF